MNATYAVCMMSTDTRCLGRLRQLPAIEVHELPKVVWLHVRETGEQSNVEIQTLPGHHYSVLPDSQLVPKGRLVPNGYLPDGPWQPLSAWMSVCIPTGSFCATIDKQVEMKLIRGDMNEESNVLMTSIDRWTDYAKNAPQFRLDRCLFAMSNDGTVVIHGLPLPPIIGIRFVEQAGVAVEAGWRLSPSIDLDVVARTLDMQQGDFALIHSSGQCEQIRADEFVRATRSAIRLSYRALHNG